MSRSLVRHYTHGHPVWCPVVAKKKKQKRNKPKKQTKKKKTSKKKKKKKKKKRKKKNRQQIFLDYFYFPAAFKSTSQERICFDSLRCCHTETDVTDTRRTCFRTDAVTPDVWAVQTQEEYQFLSHWSDWPREGGSNLWTPCSGTSSLA